MTVIFQENNIKERLILVNAADPRIAILDKEPTNISILATAKIINPNITGTLIGLTPKISPAFFKRNVATKIPRPNIRKPLNIFLKTQIDALMARENIPIVVKISPYNNIILGNS